MRGVSRPLYSFIIFSALLLMVFLLSSSIFTIPPIYHSNRGKVLEETPGPDAYTAWSVPYSKESRDDLAIANSTLGFQKIFVLGLPDRLLKRDSMEMGASVTDLDLTWMDGVLGGEMNPKSIPPVHTDPKSKWFIWDSELGCWRGHMNIIHRMVKERIASALIMEDDADWDVHIVQQLQQFANTTRDFLKEDPHSTWARKRRVPTGSPYGEGWDLLWIGHCGGYPASRPDNDHYSIIRDDNTVPPAFDSTDQIGGTNQKDRARHACSARKGSALPDGVKCETPLLTDYERIVQERTSPLCTTAYAISLQGARKMLARLGGLSLLDVTSPVDQEMKNMCRSTGGDKEPYREAARCLTVSPPYIRTHRAKGPFKGDSDIMPKKDGIRELGLSEGLVYPTRMNVENIIGGHEPESQYVRDRNGTWRYRRKDEYRPILQVGDHKLTSYDG